MYSVVIHLCLATSFVVFNALRFSLKRIPPIVYRVDYIQLGSASAKPSQKVAKVTPVKREKPKVEPQPKPEPKVAKPEPKPKVEKKQVVAPPKKAEVPKVAKAPEPKKQTPEIKTQPAPSKQEEVPPPPPPPEPERMEVAKAVEPPSQAEDPNTIDVDAAGGPTSSNIDPELRWYIETLRRKVWQNWIVPMQALPPGTHARVVIRFEIERNGTVPSTPQVLESSGISLLDQSGYGAVVRAAPFPPLPEGFRGDKLGIRFGFEYGEEA